MLNTSSALELSETVKYADIKSKKIEYLVREYANLKSSKRLHVLDVGCGTGFLTSKMFKKDFVVGLELDTKSVSWAQQHFKDTTFVNASATHVPFHSNSMDIIILNHVIEHIPNWKKALCECARVIKAEGILYLSFPNYYHPIEPHYYLPFLHHIPSAKLKNLYIDACSRIPRTDHYIHILTRRDIIKELKKYFDVRDVTFTVLQNTELIKEYEGRISFKILKKMKKYRNILKVLSWLSPTIILIAKKDIVRQT